MLWVDKTGILADPAEAGALVSRLRMGPVSVYQRFFIGLPTCSSIKLNEFLHPRGKNIVIVITQSVGGDVSLALPLSEGEE